ncbi:hypothetical protein QQP08_014574 [Theobroma cacao]|nr:hypothetical protein QQP08_014574 [Theobroma cacao]
MATGMTVDFLGITFGPGTASMSIIKAELEATSMVAMEKIKQKGWPSCNAEFFGLKSGDGTAVAEGVIPA